MPKNCDKNFSLEDHKDAKSAAVIVEQWAGAVLMFGETTAVFEKGLFVKFGNL